MPEETMWDTFFDPPEILRKLNIDSSSKTAVDIGCGYGTFLIPASRLASGNVIGIDIDPRMISLCQAKMEAQGITNVILICGDMVDNKTVEKLRGISDAIDYISLFNILHCENPGPLLQLAHSLLEEGGLLAVIHWITGNTPRGPSFEIRPTAKMIIEWAAEAGFKLVKETDLKPYHFGILFRKSG